MHRHTARFPPIRAGKGWRGRRELAPRCSAIHLAARRHDPGQTRRVLNHLNHTHHTRHTPHTPHTTHTHHTPHTPHTQHTTHTQYTTPHTQPTTHLSPPSPPSPSPPSHHHHHQACGPNGCTPVARRVRRLCAWQRHVRTASQLDLAESSTTPRDDSPVGEAWSRTQAFGDRRR